MFLLTETGCGELGRGRGRGQRARHRKRAEEGSRISAVAVDVDLAPTHRGSLGPTQHLCGGTGAACTSNKRRSIAQPPVAVSTFGGRGGGQHLADIDPYALDSQPIGRVGWFQSQDPSADKTRPDRRRRTDDATSGRLRGHGHEATGPPTAHTPSQVPPHRVLQLPLGNDNNTCTNQHRRSIGRCWARVQVARPSLRLSEPKGLQQLDLTKFRAETFATTCKCTHCRCTSRRNSRRSPPPLRPRVFL